MHISERGPFVNQRRIQTSPFNPRGHERSPKSAPQHAPTVRRNFLGMISFIILIQLIIYPLQNEWNQYSWEMGNTLDSLIQENADQIWIYKTTCYDPYNGAECFSIDTYYLIWQKDNRINLNKIDDCWTYNTIHIKEPLSDLFSFNIAKHKNEKPLQSTVNVHDCLYTLSLISSKELIFQKSIWGCQLSLKCSGDSVFNHNRNLRYVQVISHLQSVIKNYEFTNIAKSKSNDSIANQNILRNTIDVEVENPLQFNEHELDSLLKSIED
jgi:hypothetical protein